MKKFYNSADLYTSIMRSEYINSDNRFFYNTFVPIEVNNNDEAIQSIKHIKSEIKKTSNEDLLSINPDYVKATRKDTKTLIKQIKELSNNNNIKLEYGKVYKLSFVFELFYLNLLFLVKNNINLED